MIAALVLMSVLGLAQDDGMALDERVRLEVLAEEQQPFVGEVVDVRVRITLDARFLKKNLVQSFRKKLGLPVQVRLPWWPELEGARVLEVAAQGSGSSFVLNGQLDTATRVPSESAVAAFEFRRSLLAERAGRITLEAGAVSFDYADKFTESFLDGRVPVNPQRGEVAGAVFALEARELPGVGRPKGFHGAVGSFRVRSEITDSGATETTLGETITWTLTIEDQAGNGGNLAFIDAPVFDELGDFHVRGRIDRPLAGGRSIEHELVPLKVLNELPAVTFRYFDPQAEAYREARTEALPLNVVPAPDGTESIAPVAAVEDTSVTDGAEGDPDDEDPPLPAREDLGALLPAEHPSWPVRSERLGALPLVTVLLAPWILWLGLSYLVRLRERNKEDEATRRARLAVHALHQRLADPEGVPSEAFAEYLGAKLRRPAAAMIAADLASRIEAAGLASELAHETQSTLQALLHEHFGQIGARKDHTLLLRLVERLEQAFAAEEDEA